MESITIDEVLECKDLNKEAEEVQDSERAVEIIKRFEDIIKTKNKGTINVAYHQGQVFKRSSLLNSSVNWELTKLPLFLELIFLNYVKNTPNYWSLL